MKKKIFSIIGILLAILIIWRIISFFTSGSKKPAGPDKRPPVAVELDSVRYLPIQEIGQFTGTIYPIYQYVVAPKVSGRIIEIQKRIGDRVNRGEVLARIDDAEYQQAVREAEANLKIAQATLAEVKSALELARQELERVQSLQAKGIASPAELDAASSNHIAQQARLNLAYAQVEQRESLLTSAKIRLSYTVLLATDPGFIGERFIDEGAMLAPNSAVLSVVGINSVTIRTTIIEKDYGRIQMGQAATVEVDAFPTRQFTGKVARVAPILKETSRVAVMEVEVINTDLVLKPGMFARVQVVLDQRERAQVLRARALINRNGNPGVFVVPNDSSLAHFIPIQVGIATPEMTEVVTPKLEGRVVILGQHLLEDGSPVMITGTGKK